MRANGPGRESVQRWELTAIVNLRYDDRRRKRGHVDDDEERNDNSEWRRIAAVGSRVRASRTSLGDEDELAITVKGGWNMAAAQAQLKA